MDALFSFLEDRRVLILTGAGCSTLSGIPDYRGPDTGRAPRNPILHTAFLRSAFVRRRYWARSCLGWPRFAAAAPNATHFSCAALEQEGYAVGVVSQNVDGLHHAAGSRRVVELHGSLAHASCLGCGHTITRRSLQDALMAANPGWTQLVAEAAPDGDVDLPESLVEVFHSAHCRCGGEWMPNVVFFGGNVGPEVVQSAWDLFSEAQGLLVVGTSLTVFSGFRFVKKAAEQGMPVAIVNRGPTRADALATVRVNAECGEVLGEMARLLCGEVPGQ